MRFTTVSKIKKRKRLSRKNRVIVSLVIGMLESSARIDSAATERRKIEAVEFGKSLGWQRDRHGERGMKS